MLYDKRHADAVQCSAIQVVELALTRFGWQKQNRTTSTPSLMLKEDYSD